VNRESVEIVCVHYTIAFISNKLIRITEPKPSINRNKKIKDIQLSPFNNCTDELILFYIITSLIKIKICIMLIKILFNYQGELLGRTNPG